MSVRKNSSVLEFEIIGLEHTINEIFLKRSFLEKKDKIHEKHQERCFVLVQDTS